ncbi:hypothetical protein GOP47_0015897 [Adiantum capillus-veneris]|uniref:Uncharacterized protein n=1 Tax=Adiantum capillus-veneris TaxID=13818 RepID=A0A9D4ZEE4_ADICA|nr:hypothetical protein GOP47_0015897 [Adiantum capillus-veneris]
MALHEALLNGLVPQPRSSQQNMSPPLMNLGSHRPSPRMLPPLNHPGSGYLQGMSSDQLPIAGMNDTSTLLGHGQLPSYATTVRGGMDSIFRPSGPLSFPPTYVNPLWGLGGDNDQQYEIHHEFSKANAKYAGDDMGTLGTDFGRGCSPHGHTNSSSRESPLNDEEDTQEDQQLEQEGITIPYRDLEYKQKVVIGLCHGLRPSLETLKTWTNQQWFGRNLKLEQGHHIKDCHELKQNTTTTDPEPTNKNDGFQPVNKRNTSRGGKFGKQGKNKTFPSPLLENVFEPFSTFKEFNDENGPADHHDLNKISKPSQRDKDKDFMDTTGPEQEVQNLEHEEGCSSSSDSDEETIPS